MRIEWFGQSAFSLQGEQATVVIDPFNDMAALTGGAVKWDYPAIEGVDASLLLVTHEHGDHNHVDAIGGDPVVLRSTAGTLESPIGEIVAVASEHDEQAGTQRGPNTIFCFTLDGLRVCHFGDFGQSALRPEQRAAIGAVDLLIVPVGGGFTIGAGVAAELVRSLAPRWAVPMHYRTERISFLEPADDFLARFGAVERLDSPVFDSSGLRAGEGPTIVVPAAP